MKKLFIIMVLASFSLMPVIADAQTRGSGTSGPPPVKQTLIPEGFFAIKLSEALKLGSKTEAEAETTLAALGIVPKNGWIADYPVTPDVLIELQKAAGTAADSGKLSMSRDEVTKAVQSVAMELGLPPVTAEGQGSQTASAGDYGNSDPSEVNNYYDNEGPPVVTYYPPPPDYDYLYAWVPSPFWCAGFFFPGFFVLNDFDTIVIVNHHGHRHHGHHHHDGDRHHVSNHIIDPKTHRIARINPVTRTIGGNFRSTSNLTQRGFNETGNGASAILNRRLEKTGPANVGKGVVPRTNAPSASSTTRQGTGGNDARHGSSAGRSFEGSHGSGPSGGFSSSHSSGPAGAFSSSHGGGGGCRGRC